MEEMLSTISARYASNYHVEARKLRTDPAWLDATLKPFRGSEAEGEEKEKEEMAKKKEEAPLPTSISQFKGHPLYVLQRHLLKFEAIFPADAPTLGFIKGEPVYARECVKILQVALCEEGRLIIFFSGQNCLAEGGKDSQAWGVALQDSEGKA